MQPLSIGLVGCGRVGRSLVRLLSRHAGLRLAAIEELADPEAVRYLLEFDTLLGRSTDGVRAIEGGLEIGGSRVKLLRPPAEGVPPWGELGVSVVIEATGKPRSRRAFEAHLEAGARRVVVCSPSVEPPDLTLVAGVNGDRLQPGHRIVSVGSVTSNCAGPILKVLARELGIERAFLTTVHAFSNQLRLADVAAPDQRSGRAAGENIIPQETNADEVLAELIPELAGRISGLAIHVPVPNGSVVDLTCWHPRPVTVEEVNGAIRAACQGELAGLIAWETAPIVSSDILHTPWSGTFDSLSTMVVGDQVSKILTFYDNAWGYANRVVELVERLAAFERQGVGA